MYGLSRGERNNNPLNIRKSSNAWLGKIVPSHDGDFEQFDTAIDGIRAGVKILVKYYKSYGLSTVKGVISKWAPNSENPTDSYISSVCKFMGVGSYDRLDLLNPEVMQKLVSAMIDDECGCSPYSASDIAQGVSEGLG